MKGKCEIEAGKFLRPCDPLSETMEIGHPTGKRKGIFMHALSTLEGPTRSMASAKSGAFVKGGILFNYCPFCGVDISAPFSGDKGGAE